MKYIIKMLLKKPMTHLFYTYTNYKKYKQCENEAQSTLLYKEDHNYLYPNILFSGHHYQK
jgi:hypothetical protein